MEEGLLFEQPGDRPLADRLRPETIDDIVGQEHLLGPDGPIRKMLETKRISSFILWGPPGCGKTTIARLMANGTDMHFVALSAVFSGIADLRKAFDEAAKRRLYGERTLLFVDEIHRFNRALLSRCKVFIMKPLDSAALQQIIERAEKIVGRKLPIDDDAVSMVRDLADGDGRYLINLIESIYDLAPPDGVMNRTEVEKIVQHRAPVYDKDGEGHYNLISALHKSLRGSDTDAALYWAARMIEGGEDPLYLLRRLTRFAMEDVSLADPQALPMAVAAWDAYERLGSPEGDIAIAELVIYLGTAPKSNSAEVAWNKARAAAKQFSSLNPPAHILNAPTKFMKEIGYGTGSVYDHDTPEGFSGHDYCPETMPRQRFYNPPELGFEREILRRLQYWERLRAEKKKSGR